MYFRSPNNYIVFVLVNSWFAKTSRHIVLICFQVALITFWSEPCASLSICANMIEYQVFDFIL